MPLTFRALPRTKTFSSTYVSPRKLSDIRALSGSPRQSLGRFAGAGIPAARQHATVNEINDLRTRSKSKWHWAILPAAGFQPAFDHDGARRESRSRLACDCFPLITVRLSGGSVDNPVVWPGISDP